MTAHIDRQALPAACLAGKREAFIMHSLTFLLVWEAPSDNEGGQAP